MPPKRGTSKKRARSRSPSGVKVDGKKVLAPTRSSKRLKKDASDASAVATDVDKAQKKVVEKTKTTAAKRGKKAVPAPVPVPVPATAPVVAPAPPSFSGKFDLFAMNLSPLNSVFSPSRDYSALLAALRKHQPKPDNDDDNNKNNDDDPLPQTRIVLPAGLALNDDDDDDDGRVGELPRGKFRSEVVLDPVAWTSWEIALDAVELVDRVEFGAFEQAGEEDVFYSRPDSTSSSSESESDPEESEPERDPTPKPASDRDRDRDRDATQSLGVIADVALENRWHRGVKKAGGVFQMRRAWVGEDGKDEVFEGYFYFEMDYSGYYRGKCPEDGWVVKMPFWAVRARVGENDDEDEKNGNDEFGSWGGKGRGRRGFGMCQYDFGCY